MTAERIFYGAIYTAAPLGTTAEAMAVADGRLLAVGSKEDVAPYLAENTQITYFDGLMIPGITEGHAHVTCAYEMVFGVALGHEEEPEGYLDKIRAFHNSHPNAVCILGSGYDNSVFGPNGPTAKLLDSVSRDIPIVVIASDHHSRWVNTRVMELAGITDETANPLNGEIVRDAEGHATGWLKETAMEFSKPVIPTPTAEEYAQAIAYYQEIALENGVTNVFEPMFDSLRDYDVRADGYRMLDEAGNLYLNARLGYSLEADDDLSKAFDRMKIIRERLRSCPHVQLTTAKFFIDGVVECHTAYLREDYSDAPGDRGEATFPQEELNRWIMRAMQEGFDLHAHVIGDAAADMALTAYEQAQNTLGSRDYRNALTHLQILHPDQIERMQRSGILAVTNPYWHYSNPSYYDELEKPFLGDARAKREYPMQSLIAHGIQPSQASDFPVTVPPRTMDAMHLCVNRQEPGHTEFAELGNHECLTLPQALNALTRNGAYQLRLEDRKGSLEAGKDADFVLLEPNPFTLADSELYTTQVMQTWIGGICRYQRECR